MSSLLTISKIVEFNRNRDDTYSLRKKILTNTFKYQGKWYEFHKVPNRIETKYNLKNLVHDTEITQEISKFDLESLGFTDVYDTGDDYYSLVYNTRSDTLKAVRYGHKYPFVCTHKRQDKPGKKKYIICYALNLVGLKV